MVKIENEKLTVLINKFGAELKSVINKENGIEYIWPGTEGSFKKSAPNLFPFIGNILSGEIDYPLGKNERVTLPMTKHGFARDLEFETLEVTNDTARFQLKPNSYTKERYPYNFSLIVEYILVEDTLHHNYIVKNIFSEDWVLWEIITTSWTFLKVPLICSCISLKNIK